jgi:hypothetical protein
MIELLRNLATDAELTLTLLETEGRDTGIGGPISELRDSVEAAKVYLAAERLASRHGLPTLRRWHRMVEGKPQSAILARAVEMREFLADV